MHRLVILLVCCVLVAASNAIAAVRFGLKAGSAFAGVSPNDLAGGLIEFEGKIGPGGGAFATWELGEWFGVRGELLYVSKGLSLWEAEATDDFGANLGTFETLRVVDYLEVPLLIEAAWPTSGPWRPAFTFGPAVAFKIDERQVMTGAIEGSEGTNGFTSTDFGLTAGGELRLRAGPGWALIETRYTLGLVDVAEDFYISEEKNRAFMVMAGYIF